MADLLAIAQGLNALKATTDIIKTMVGLRDAAQILEKTVELNQKILTVQTALADAQAEQTTMVQTVRELEEEIARLNAWEAEKQRYELRDLGDPSGSFVYAVKPEAKGHEPFHCICANCYERRKKSIIQRTGERDLGRRVWKCPECNSTILVYQWPSP
jgi:hypothetical protein